MSSISPTDKGPTLPAARPHRWRRRLARLAFVLAVLCTVVTGFYLVERYRGRAAWDDYAAEARARGVKLTLDQYIPKPVPPDENFASIPVFETLYRDFDAKREMPDPFKLPARNGGALPSLSDPIQQKPIDLVAWQKYFLEVKLLDSAGENAAGDVLKALAHFAEPLAQLHEAGARPHCVFPVHWEQKWGAGLPHLALLMDASKLLALRMGAHLAQGQTQAAFADFQDGFRLTTITREEPSMIEGLVRISTAVLTLNAVWGGLAEHQWTAPELSLIESDLATMDWPADFRFSMSSERGLNNDIFDYLAANPAKLPAFIVPTNGDPRPVTFSEWALQFYPSGWVYRSKVRMNLYHDELVAAVDPSRRSWIPNVSTPSAPTKPQSMFPRIHYLLFFLLAPSFETPEARWIQTATWTDQARIACALERFHLGRGTYPEKLTALAPGFIGTVPVEFVNGEPYHYRLHDAGGFVLYSVGANLHDDGGVIDPKLPNAEQRDWVWRYPGK